MATRSHAEFSVSERVPFRVGLTGGIGSGKSLVADRFAAIGVVVVDTDAIAHRLTAPGGAAIEPIRRSFGDSFIDAAGALDRARMRTRVFSDATAKRGLESILHPLIRAQADTDAVEARSAPYVIVAVPLLVESGDWAARVDRVLVIDCPVTQQVDRVVRTRCVPRQQVEAIVSQQASREQRLLAADDVLINAGPPDLIAPRVARLHGHYSALASAGREPTRPL